MRNSARNSAWGILKRMKAIGYTEAGPISAENALFEFETEIPQPGPNDLLVS